MKKFKKIAIALTGLTIMSATALPAATISASALDNAEFESICNEDYDSAFKTLRQRLDRGEIGNNTYMKMFEELEAKRNLKNYLDSHSDLELSLDLYLSPDDSAAPFVIIGNKADLKPYSTEIYFDSCEIIDSVETDDSLEFHGTVVIPKYYDFKSLKISCGSDEKFIDMNLSIENNQASYTFNSNENQEKETPTETTPITEETTSVTEETNPADLKASDNQEKKGDSVIITIINIFKSFF
ncbi:MAG: hypothetical protein IJM19_02545 [Ruminococcus sp.]|nr:hypothetical protein [Ruminococcus sp.]